WMFVIAAFILSAFFLLRGKKERRDGLMPGLLIVSGFILFCLLATMETFYYWEINRRGLSDGEAHLFSTLVVLWSLISSATLFVILRNKWMQWLPLPLICYAVAGLIFLLGFMEYDIKSSDLALNAVFLPRLAFILAILWGGQRLKRGGFEIPGVFFGVTGQMLLTLLMTVEMVRWVDRTDLVSDRMGLSLISALWAVQAFALVAWGLIRANRPLRILGIFLFGMTVLKVIVLDTSELEKIYRIVSFAASGLFLLLAGYCYQRFSSAFIKDRKPGENS
ncbi:MAG TPA: DUF2339 domain-containing protein, partial [Candidatus Sumerlaeota bacterium]|nr:DUF2339 domain-containing protein [Candidatus Sumerlaeota bacterium]